MWGSPIRHSLSPALHNAAYRALGIDAHYSSRDVGADLLSTELTRLSPEYRGISLTMPLKEAVLSLVDNHRGLVGELGAANTIVRGPDGWVLWNTDPEGVAGALQEASLASCDSATILGAGATARSVLCALPRFGVSEVVVYSRDRSRARKTLDYGATKGLSVTWASLDDLATADPSDLVVSTLPHGVSVEGQISQQLVAAAALLDVTYDPWPSGLATRWARSEHPVISGRPMLLHQAVSQIRIFTGGSPDIPLHNEDDVIRSMRQAIA